MGVYDRPIATAKKLIKKFGAVATWTQKTEVVPDPNKPWEKENSGESVFNPTIALFPFTASSRSLIQYLKGSEVPVGSLWALMPQVDFIPSLKDSFVIDGKNYTLLNIDILAPNGDVVLYTLELSLD